MGNRLFVGNLHPQATSADLNQLFSEFGTVQDVEVMLGRNGSRNKGYAFVEMNSEAEAQAAIKGLADREIEGRRLTVDEAKPRRFRSGGGFGGGGGGFDGGGGGYGRGEGRGRW